MWPNGLGHMIHDPLGHASDIKLWRTDTTLDLSQKAEKGMLFTVACFCFYSSSVLSLFSHLFHVGHRHAKIEYMPRPRSFGYSGHQTRCIRCLIGLLPFIALDLGHDASKTWYNFQAQTRAFFVLNAIH